MLRRIAEIFALVVATGYLSFSILELTHRPGGDSVCDKVSVKIHDSLKCGILNEARVLEVLSRNGLNPIGKSLDEIDMDTMEHVLVKHPMIASAECFLTAENCVRIKIHCVVPLVRVLSRSGADYMVGSRGEIIDYRGSAVNLPVATGYISRTYASNQLMTVVRDIYSSKFWSAQIVQIDVDENGQVSLVPRVGGHIIDIGAPDNVEEKLERVMRFYEDGLNVIGWNKYNRVSVAFEDQVVCRKK